MALQVLAGLVGTVSAVLVQMTVSGREICLRISTTST
jgi:hypothetical protein